MGWTILVLIPKGNKDTWGIGLLEILWNVVEAIINTCLWDSIQFHDLLYGLLAGRGTGASNMDLNIAQELSRVYQDPLLIFLVFLALRKY